MKSIGKIYKGLSPRAAAVVAWGLSASGSLETECLVASVRHEYRIAPTMEFGETIIWLEALTKCWAIIHWRLMYDHANAVSAFTQSSDRNESDSNLAAAVARLRVAESRLMSCDLALNNAAESFGFDAHIVRDMVTATPFIGVVPDAGSDPNFTIEVRTAIMGARANHV